MTPQPYGGPTALAYSKYASPHMRCAQLASVPLAVSSANSSPTRNTIATKEQIAATHHESAVEMVAQNADAELAIAQGNNLKDEVEKHSATFARTVSITVNNTREFLGLIRAALNKDDASALKTVEDLWTELEQLFDAAKQSKDALPDFMEKQRNNMALYHASVMNETFRESQEELNMQHKKVNLQHSLILEHQQAFQEYKEKTATKLKELEDLQERVSRLTLEKGNFRGEIDKYTKLLEQEQSTKNDELKKVEALQRELETLLDSKKQLQDETESLRKNISDLEKKMAAAEQKTTDRYTAELKAKDDQLAKETTKTMSLNTLINSLKGDEGNNKKEVEKLRAELKNLNEKYTRMGAEHSQAFAQNQENNKKLSTLTNDTGRLRKENAELAERLTKLAGLEKSNTELFTNKANLLEQVGNLTTELGHARTSIDKVKQELAATTEKMRKLTTDNEALKTENKAHLEMQSKMQDENKTSLQAVSIFKNETAALRNKIEQLKSTQAAPAVGGPQHTDMENKALQERVRVLEEKKDGLEKALEEWTVLAKRSYKEYKDMLPAYKQADSYRVDALNKTQEIQKLKAELSAAKALQSNGVAAGAGGGADAAYWKTKYDTLLSSYSA